MTTTAERVAQRPDAPDRRRRGRRRLIVAAVALVLAGGLTSYGTVRHLDRQYGPLLGGRFGGPYSQRGFAPSKSFPEALAAAPAATGRLLISLENLGAHSVKITSIQTGDIVSEIRWSVYHAVAGGSISGVATPWRAFPAIVPAHGAIRLLITMHHPGNCSAFPKYRGVSQAR